jgi:hypothetical protein
MNKSRKSLKLLSLDFIILTLLILYTANASTLVQNDIFTGCIFIFLSALFYIKKCKVNKIILNVLIAWIFINFFSSAIANPNMPFSMLTFIGVTARIIMAYLMIKIVGPNIMDKLLQYVYFLTIISLFVFIIQSITPSLFYSLSSLLNFMTQSEQVSANGWYIFIYMFSGWGAHRNCGFMWEPGAFASILVIFIMYRFQTNNFKLDKVIIVFFITLITTFSTAGYLALGFIMAAFMYKNKIKLINPLYLILYITLIIGGYYTYKKEIFMEPKIIRYIEQGTDSYIHSSGIIRVSRLGIAIIAFDYSTQWPFGNGILKSENKLKKYGDVSGPNSLVNILHQWGWIGLIIFFIIFFRFFRYYSHSNIVSFLFLFALIIVLFSNPFAFKYLIYTLFFYTFIYLKRKIIYYKEVDNV